MNPSSIAVQAALQTLAAAGFTIQPPASARSQTVSPDELATLLRVNAATARRIMGEHFARLIRLPGGDLRVYLSDVEEFLANRASPRLQEAA